MKSVIPVATVIVALLISNATPAQSVEGAQLSAQGCETVANIVASAPLNRDDGMTIENYKAAIDEQNKDAPEAAKIVVDRLIESAWVSTSTPKALYDGFLSGCLKHDGRIFGVSL